MELHFICPGSKKHCFVLWCSHYQLQETKNTSNAYVFEEGNYTQEEVKTKSVKWKSSRNVAALMQWQESNSIKPWNVPRYSENHITLLTSLLVIVSIPYVNLTKRSLQLLNLVLLMACRILLLILRSHHHQCHSYWSSWFSTGEKLKGIRYINKQSKLLIESMSAVDVCPSHLNILLEMLNESYVSFPSTTIKNLIQICELFHQKELGIDHTLSSAEKMMEFLSKVSTMSYDFFVMSFYTYFFSSIL